MDISVIDLIIIIVRLSWPPSKVKSNLKTGEELTSSVLKCISQRFNCVSQCFVQIFLLQVCPCLWRPLVLLSAIDARWPKCADMIPVETIRDRSLIMGIRDGVPQNRINVGLKPLVPPPPPIDTG